MPQQSAALQQRQRAVEVTAEQQAIRHFAKLAECAAAAQRTSFRHLVHCTAVPSELYCTSSWYSCTGQQAGGARS